MGFRIADIRGDNERVYAVVYVDGNANCDIVVADYSGKVTKAPNTFRDVLVAEIEVQLRQLLRTREVA